MEKKAKKDKKAKKEKKRKRSEQEEEEEEEDKSAEVLAKTKEKNSSKLQSKTTTLFSLFKRSIYCGRYEE